MLDYYCNKALKERIIKKKNRILTSKARYLKKQLIVDELLKQVYDKAIEYNN